MKEELKEFLQIQNHNTQEEVEFLEIDDIDDINDSEINIKDCFDELSEEEFDEIY